MDKIKILAIAPYQGMCELMNRIVADREDIDLTVHVGDLECGLEKASRATENTDYDIIISRGGTADLISNSLSLPTLDVAISLGDILQATKLAENYKAKFAIVGFPSITKRAKIICDLLNYDIEVYTIHNGEEASTLLNNIKTKGITMVVCDTITFALAQKIGLNAVLITSSEESLHSAFDQAVKLCRSNSIMRNQNKVFLQALRNRGNTIIMTIDGNIEFSSSQFISEETLKIAQDTIQTTLNHGICKIEKKVRGQRVIVNSEKYSVKNSDYIIAEITTIPIPPLSGDHCITVINNDDIIEEYNYYYVTCTNFKDFHEVINSYSSSLLPVLILGEEGTGMDAVAVKIYKGGLHKHNPFYEICCSRMDDKTWNYLLQNPSSPLYSTKCTIYLKDADKLTEAQLNDICVLNDQSSLAQRNKIICSFTTEIGVKSSKLIRNFISNISGLSLNLPPLRERKSDLPSLAALYIGELNTDLGRQISGFEAEALELLQTYEWPQNIDQLKRVLRELAVMSSQFYITKEDVKEIIAKEQIISKTRMQGSLNLNRPLDEITFDIICTVLAKENGNQKRAAEKLGISRSTLWRLLKEHK